jgi:hypothetical protein
MLPVGAFAVSTCGFNRCCVGYVVCVVLIGHRGA